MHYYTGRLQLKMQKIDRVNLVRLNFLKPREIIEQHWICPCRNRTRSIQKKNMATPSRTSFARGPASGISDEDSLEIHSPVLESIHSRWIVSTWFSSFIELPWINSTHKLNGFKFNPIQGRLFWSSGGQGGGGGGAQSAPPPCKNPVPLLRIYSGNIFLKACPKLSLVKQTWFPWQPWLWF